MRSDISVNRFSWLYKLDYKKIIIIAFLLRLITASIYDIFVSLAGKDIILPDSLFYSLNGKYISIIFSGYDVRFLPQGLLPAGMNAQKIFFDIVSEWKNQLPNCSNEGILYFYIIGVIYFVVGYIPIVIKIMNITLSILSTFFIFRIAQRQFGDLPANIFLVIGLFLPTHFLYSITMSRDFIRVFIVCFIFWLLYGGVIWRKSGS